MKSLKNFIWNPWSSNSLNPYIALGGRNPFRACFFINLHFSNKRLYKKLPIIIWYRIMCVGFATWLFQVDHRYNFLDNYNFRSNYIVFIFFYCCNLFLLILLARVQISECNLIIESTNSEQNLASEISFTTGRVLFKW